ncbi:MAG: phosphoenolpyruvate synthase, partial [Candidatus Geothermincolia bacterium]
QEGMRPIIRKSVGDKEHKLVYADGERGSSKNIDTTQRERRAYSITDDEALRLARWSVVIERHYGKPMDMEWAKDGQTGELMIVQARPETVQAQRSLSVMKTYRLLETGKRLVTGLAIGDCISSGKVMVIKSPSEIERFQPGSVLVTGMTDPDWVPIMKQSCGIVTDYGGRTSHAAIVSRELGITAIVGTQNATSILAEDQEVTLSCAEGAEGYVYEGRLRYEAEDVDLESLPETRTRMMINVAEPAAATSYWRLPVRGIGLARMEFIVNNIIRIHPMALVHYDRLADRHARNLIAEMTAGYRDKTEYFVDKLALGVAEIAASQHPEPVLIRMSDFKTNEYANLIGGAEFEPHEENPMIGFRGASRYYNPRYREGFALECRAVKRVREEMGLANLIVMIPFCRTLDEADRVLETMAAEGLERGAAGLEVYVMCEIPSNVLLATEFSSRFDGFSIGSNDLTQLVLGVDRDSAELAELFDERDEAVKRSISALLRDAHRAGRKVGICGQAPSTFPDFAAWLVREGIDSISLNPDSVVSVIPKVAEAEAELEKDARAAS